MGHGQPSQHHENQISTGSSCAAKYYVGKTGAGSPRIPASEMVPVLKPEPPRALRGQGLDLDACVVLHKHLLGNFLPLHAHTLGPAVSQLGEGAAHPPTSQGFCPGWL